MKHSFFQPVFFLLLVLSGLAGCRPDPAEEPSDSLPPQQQLPNPLPAKALVTLLWWAEKDHQSFSYNAKGQVSQLTSQWQFVEGDPTQIRTITYNFQYDAQDRPSGITTTDGFSAKYFYNGNVIDKTQELYPGGAISNELTYRYRNGRVSEEHWRIPGIAGDPDDVYKHAFSYDAKGNLNLIETYERDSLQQYRLLEKVEYLDFDDKINPTSWMMRYPYLPQMRFQINNPRREIHTRTGEAPVITLNEYEYNADGVPVSRRTTKPSGELVMEYHY